MKNLIDFDSIKDNSITGLDRNSYGRVKITTGTCNLVHGFYVKPTIMVTKLIIRKKYPFIFLH